MFTVSHHEQILHCAPRPFPNDRRWKPNVEIAPDCPRCASNNTKFSYYNNYSLSQPRYFCKGCRRYWTKGGSLRNVPVGDACRKSRRGKSNRVQKTGSMNYGKNSSSFGSHHQDEMIGVIRSSPDGEQGNKKAAANGSDIDLAVVFAKYFNQSTSFDYQPDEENLVSHQELANEANEGNNIDAWSSEQDTNSSQNDSISTECQNHPEVLFHSIPESYILQELPQVKLKQQLEDQNFNNNCIEELLLETDHHMNGFGLPNLLADEMVQMDALWSSSSTTPFFEWQPMTQLQQFESFPVEDQLKINSANLMMSKNWGSYDLSGFGLLPKT